jgi:hypothetical protein
MPESLIVSFPVYLLKIKQKFSRQALCEVGWCQPHATVAARLAAKLVLQLHVLPAANPLDDILQLHVLPAANPLDDNPHHSPVAQAAGRTKHEIQQERGSMQASCSSSQVMA